MRPSGREDNPLRFQIISGRGVWNGVAVAGRAVLRQGLISLGPGCVKEQGRVRAFGDQGEGRRLIAIAGETSCPVEILPGLKQLGQLGIAQSKHPAFDATQTLALHAADDRRDLGLGHIRRQTLPAEPASEGLAGVEFVQGVEEGFERRPGGGMRRTRRAILAQHGRPFDTGRVRIASRWH